MPRLARDFEVIAVDQRGMGPSDKPEGGYDTGTQARDLVALMDARRPSRLPTRRSTTTSASCSPDSLRGSFGWYRALDATIAQDEQRKAPRLTIPVLAIGGQASFAEHVGEALRAVADDVLAALTPFLSHYRDQALAAHHNGSHAVTA